MADSRNSNRNNYARVRTQQRLVYNPMKEEDRLRAQRKREETLERLRGLPTAERVRLRKKIQRQRAAERQRKFRAEQKRKWNQMMSRIDKRVD